MFHKFDMITFYIVTALNEANRTVKYRFNKYSRVLLTLILNKFKQHNSYQFIITFIEALQINYQFYKYIKRYLKNALKKYTVF